MNIKLIPSGGTKFTFPSLPEQIRVKQAAKYQSFDIISQGTVKIPKGTDVEEISWSGEFFGKSKKKEPIVKKNSWKKPNECVRILHDFMKNETALNLIVTGTWINLDVTISSFQPTVYGAYGNIKYTITFVQKKPLEIYATNELQIADFVKKTMPRNDGCGDDASKGSYTVVSGDTLWGIANSHCGGSTNWPKLYDANAAVIEATAQAHGKPNSDHGHWIWPGEVLTLV